MTTQPDVTTDPVTCFCARCSAELRPGSGDFYRVAIEAVADPTPPRFSAEDLSADIRRQIEQLLARMKDLTPQEALDQVYRRLTLYLCGPCFRRWIENPAG